MTDPGILSVQNDRPYSGVVTPAGTLVITVRSMQSAVWEVTQVTTEMPTAPVGATSIVRKNGNKVTSMLATGDVGADKPSVVLRQNDVMTVEWAGCTPGDIGKVFVFYNQ